MARKSTKGRGSTKRKAAEKEQVVETTEVAEASTSTEIPQSVTEVAVEVASDLAESAKESVDIVMQSVEEKVTEVSQAAAEFVETMNGAPAVESDSQNASEEPEDDGTPQASSSLTPAERMKKLQELRKRMQESATANRSAVIKEATTHRVTVRDQVRLERQKHLAEVLRSKAKAEEEGREDDFERQKNWEYTIEENDAWEKKMKRKIGRADFQFHDEAHQARKKYKNDLDQLRPDLVAYNRQKEIALGLAPGTLVKITDEGKQVVSAPTSEEQRLAAENLYRDSNSLIYADSKPTEEAIDRVVEKINKDVDKRNKFSRKRPNQDDGLITYINERNRVFNKKIARFYDKYTEEIRASFERGTAL